MLIASSQPERQGSPPSLRVSEEAVALRHFLIGIGEGAVFAVIIALVGCCGFQIRGGVDDIGTTYHDQRRADIFW